MIFSVVTFFFLKTFSILFFQYENFVEEEIMDLERSRGFGEKEGNE